MLFLSPGGPGDPPLPVATLCSWPAVQGPDDPDGWGISWTEDEEGEGSPEVDVVAPEGDDLALEIRIDLGGGRVVAWTQPLEEGDDGATIDIPDEVGTTLAGLSIVARATEPETGARSGARTLSGYVWRQNDGSIGLTDEAEVAKLVVPLAGAVDDGTEEAEWVGREVQP